MSGRNKAALVQPLLLSIADVAVQLGVYRQTVYTYIYYEGLPSIKIIQELLGHSDIVITLRTYGHLLPSMQGDVVETWEDEFRGDV